NHPLEFYIPESWPSAEIIDRVVRKSSGQFIYVSTVMKYLDSPNHRPMKRYILSCVDDLASTLKIFGFWFFQYWDYTKSVTPYFVADLLGLEEEDLHLCLSELHSIPHIPPPQTSGLSIKVIHASLQEILVDPLRSGRYYVDEEAFHTDLAQQCLRKVNTLSISAIERSPRRSEGAQKYLLNAFISHCSRASKDSTNLKNDLMQVADLRPWCEINQPNFQYELPSLFDWISKVCYVPTDVLHFEINPSISGSHGG
ncbi:hypothetical protein BYT27DRAFT_7201117, partial [Phlegmacium glaucopus]